MKTDVREKKDGYELDIDLPGFKKEDIKVTLENGYMTISHRRILQRRQKNGRFIRKERFSGACERSFYVGENLTQEDIQGGIQTWRTEIEDPEERSGSSGGRE